MVKIKRNSDFCRSFLINKEFCYRGRKPLKSREHKVPGTLNSQGKDIWVSFGNTCSNGCCYLKKINEIVPWANGNQGAPSESLEGILIFCPSRGFLPEADIF